MMLSQSQGQAFQASGREIEIVVYKQLQTPKPSKARLIPDTAVTSNKTASAWKSTRLI